MRQITKWLEGGAYFTLGSVVIFLLYYIAQVADGRFPRGRSQYRNPDAPDFFGSLLRSLCARAGRAVATL